MNYKRRFFLLMGASALIASACTRATQPNKQAMTTANKTVKRVKHAFGETEVPANPTRLIVLGYTTVEAVMAHGVQPIGAPDGVVSSLAHLSFDRETTSDVGSPTQPNLEKIVALKLDLILTSKYRIREGYPLLEQIAPTVVFDIDNTDAATQIQTEIDRMKAHPRWSQLKAVKTNRFTRSIPIG